MKLAKISFRLTFALFFISLLISGCAGERPPSARISVSASNELNPNANGRPSPVVLKIFALSSTGIFDNARFFELYENSVSTLGVDLLDQFEYQILPGEETVLDPLTLDLGANYLGLLAAYRDLDNSNWRTWVVIEPGETANFEIVLDRLSLSTNARR